MSIIVFEKNSELEQHYIFLEIAMQFNKGNFQKNNTSVNQNEPSFDQLFELNNLKAELQAKDTTIKKLKTNIKHLNKTSTTNNVKKDIDEIDTINIELEHRLIQELLGYVRDTCPDIHKPSEKLVAVTPINKRKKVRFADTVTSSNNTPKASNRPLLSSTGVNPSTSASGLKPSGNTRNDRILRTPSSNEKNKVEVQCRKVKSSLNKRNSDSKNICNEHIKHPIKGAKVLCSVCNECLFDSNHAIYLIDHVNSINVRAKSISKKIKKRKEWKPTKKVFNSVGYKWKPIGRTFTLVGNACPLTSKPKVAKSVTTNKMDPGTSRGSDTSVAPSSSSLIDCRLSKFFCGIWTPDIRNVTISKVYHLEGLGHNLFSIGQFCDSDLEAFNGYALKKKAYHIYNRRTRKIIETIHVDFDELTAMASEQLGSRPGLQCMTPATPSSGLFPNTTPSASFVPPLRHEWDLVFQPVFDEFFSPPASVASPVPIEEAPAPVETTGSRSSTTVDQDTPSPSTSQTTPQSQSQTIPLCDKEESHDLEVTHMSNDPYFGILIPETVSKESSSSDVISTTVHSDAPISEHLIKWKNIICYKT
ncbi:hypothetical protein Tco_0000363 [Tanacetum coccineum]